MMQIIKSILEMQEIAEKHRSQNQSIACVPTMGYLHEGHLSLIKTANELADIVVTTLFVNPKQFGPNEDFSKYPRDMLKDSRLASDAGSQYMFMPSVEEMYPPGFQTNIILNKITEKFEGQFRPGHFDGVATVIVKLFNSVKPHLAVFGQKDFQQSNLIKQLVTDLNMDIEIIINPTVREADGLAMSSRNVYLNEDERRTAASIYGALKSTESLIQAGEKNRKKINQHLFDVLLETQRLEVDYASSAYADSFDEPDEFTSKREIVLLVAAKLGKTRLIDNMLINVK